MHLNPESFVDNFVPQSKSMIVASRLNRNWIQLWKGVVWYIQKKLGAEKNAKKKQKQAKGLTAARCAELQPKLEMKPKTNLNAKRKERNKLEFTNERKSDLELAVSGFSGVQQNSHVT